MSLILAKFANTDPNSFVQNQDQFEVLLDPTGNITKTAAGLAMNVDLGEFRGIVDPVADGGTAALPTAAGADTTVNNGTAIQAGQYYIVATDGTIGTTAVTAPGLFMANIDNPTLDTHWEFIAGNDPSSKADAVRTLTAGAGLTGGGDLTADRTFDIGAGNGITVNADDITVAPDAVTGGDIAPVSVVANGVGVDVTALDGDHLTIDYTPTNYTPDATPAEANDVDDLTAHLKGIDDVLASTGRTVEQFTLTAAQITGGITLSGTPTKPTETQLTVIGGSDQAYTTDYTVAGTVVTLTAAFQAILAAGDVIQVNWL